MPEVLEQIIGGKRIYEVEDHHHVLIPWQKETAFAGTKVHILTLDHHTDTLPAFTHYNETHSVPHPVENLKAEEAIPDLRHDEHFDFAVRAGIIRSGTIFSHVNFSVNVNPAVAIIHDRPQDESIPALGRYYAQILESDFLQNNLERAPLPQDVPYILDIDLDCFKGAESVAPGNPSVFLELIRNACAITVSRERDWVRLLNLDYGKLEYPYFLSRLYQWILQA